MLECEEPRTVTLGVATHAPEDVEPAVVMSEAPWHQRVLDVARAQVPCAFGDYFRLVECSG